MGDNVIQKNWQELIRPEKLQVATGNDAKRIATVVAEGCCLGAALAQTAGAEDLQAAYGAFVSEAREIRPDYQSRTVSVDG